MRLKILEKDGMYLKLQLEESILDEFVVLDVLGKFQLSSPPYGAPPQEKTLSPQSLPHNTARGSLPFWEREKECPQSAAKN